MAHEMPMRMSQSTVPRRSAARRPFLFDQLLRSNLRNPLWEAFKVAYPRYADASSDDIVDALLDTAEIAHDAHNAVLKTHGAELTWELHAAAAGLACPMPGTLLRFEAEVGATVEAGAPLAVVEAMKMQNVLRAETRVVVDELLADVGDVVAADQMLMTFVVDSSDT